MNKKTVTEAIGEIEDRFIAEAMDYKCERRHIIMNIKKIAAIAAAVIVTLVATVSAAAFTGLIGKEKAFEAARAYVIRNTDEYGKVSTWTLFCEGLEYDTSVEETEVKLGLTAGLRSVYKVKFKIAGYSYDITVDAKTGTVLDWSWETDEGWEEHLEEVEFRGPADGVWDPEAIVGYDALDIATDYFGLYNTGYIGCGVNGGSAGTAPNFDTEPYSVHVDYEHGGYIYSCDINGTTGEVMNAEITEDESYSGERHLHEPNYDLIGLHRAVMIVRENLGITGKNEGDPTIIARYEPSEAMLEHEGEFLPVYNGYGTDVYIVTINQGLTQANIAVDAYTGEIIEKKVGLDDPTTAPNQDVSTDAPDGLISEATAKAIALEDARVEEIRMSDFKIELTDGKYDIYFNGSREDENGMGEYGEFSYEIDAETGAILSYAISKITLE